MTIDEEMHRGWRREWIQEAIDSGELVPVEIAKEQAINNYLKTVSFMIDEGIDIQRALEAIPEDIREEVERRFRAKDTDSF